MPFPDSQYPSVARGYDKRQSERLLNAAPDLLSALRLGMEWCENDGYPDDHCMVSDHERLFRQAARAAIAKAEGRHGEAD